MSRAIFVAIALIACIAVASAQYLSGLSAYPAAYATYGAAWPGYAVASPAYAAPIAAGYPYSTAYLLKK